MQKTKIVTEPREVTDDIFCDICGNGTKKEFNYEYAELYADWGWDSTQDGEHHQCDICEICYKTVRAYI